MIPFEFEYYRPVRIQDAVQLFSKLEGEGKKAVFYSGGTEIITLSRINQFYMDAVIDIKEIPECNQISNSNDSLVLGSALTLTQITYQNAFPLLAKTAGEVADHTARNKITLGGNVTGTIRFKEAILPLLLTDAEAVIASKNGVETLGIREIFDRNFQLKPGVLVIQFIVKQSLSIAPFAAYKQRTIGNVGYPVLTLNMMKANGEIRLAASGISYYPVRSLEVEQELNNRTRSLEERIDKAILNWPQPIIDDTQGSGEFKRFLLRNKLKELLPVLED